MHLSCQLELRLSQDQHLQLVLRYLFLMNMQPELTRQQLMTLTRFYDVSALA
jgi:hypothetical protein